MTKNWSVSDHCSKWIYCIGFCALNRSMCFVLLFKFGDCNLRKIISTERQQKGLDHITRGNIRGLEIFLEDINECLMLFMCKAQHLTMQRNHLLYHHLYPEYSSDWFQCYQPEHFPDRTHMMMHHYRNIRVPHPPTAAGTEHTAHAFLTRLFLISLANL